MHFPARPFPSSQHISGSMLLNLKWILQTLYSNWETSYPQWARRSTGHLEQQSPPKAKPWGCCTFSDSFWTPLNFLKTFENKKWNGLHTQSSPWKCQITQHHRVKLPVTKNTESRKSNYYSTTYSRQLLITYQIHLLVCFYSLFIPFSRIASTQGNILRACWVICRFSGWWGMER